MHDYQKSPHYVNATAQEKRWFDIYIESLDLQAATYGAFRVSNDESARTYGKAVMNRPHIAALIAEFCTPIKPLPTIDELKRQYIDIANDPKSTQREKLLALNSYERLCGFGVHKKNAQSDDQDVFNSLDDITEI